MQKTLPLALGLLFGLAFQSLLFAQGASNQAAVTKDLPLVARFSRTADRYGGSVAWHPFSYIVKEGYLPNVIAYAFEISPERIIDPDHLSTGSYDLEVRFPERPMTSDSEKAEAESKIKRVAQELIQKGLGVNARREQREMDVFIMSPDPTRKVEFSTGKKCDGTFYSDEKECNGNGDLDNLANCLAGVLNKPVINAFSEKGTLFWNLHYDPAKHPQSVIDAVREAKGIELTPSRRTIEVLVLEKK